MEAISISYSCGTGGPVVIKEGPVTQKKDLKSGEVLVKVRMHVTRRHDDEAHATILFVDHLFWSLSYR